MNVAQASYVKAGRDYIIELTTSDIDAELQMDYTNTYQRVHGIQVKDTNGAIVYDYPDLSVLRDDVIRFIDLLVDNDASLIHIPDHVEDFLV